MHGPFRQMVTFDSLPIKKGASPVAAPPAHPCPEEMLWSTRFSYSLTCNFISPLVSFFFSFLKIFLGPVTSNFPHVIKVSCGKPRCESVTCCSPAGRAPFLGTPSPLTKALEGSDAPPGAALWLVFWGGGKGLPSCHSTPSPLQPHSPVHHCPIIESLTLAVFVKRVSVFGHFILVPCFAFWIYGSRFSNRHQRRPYKQRKTQRAPTKLHRRQTCPIPARPCPVQPPYFISK